jgi:hypothetical protein
MATVSASENFEVLHSVRSLQNQDAADNQVPSTLLIEPFLHNSNAFKDLLGRRNGNDRNPDYFSKLNEEDCSAVSSKLSTHSSSIYFSVRTTGLKLIKAIKCKPNDQGLKMIVLFSSRAFESADKEQRFFNSKLVEGIINGLNLSDETEVVNLCDDGFIEPSTGNCEQSRNLRQLVMDNSEALLMYDAYLVNYTIPVAISFMVFEDISKSFYNTLASDLIEFAIGNSSVASQVYNEDDYDMVYSAVYDLMTFSGSFLITEITPATFDNIFNCLLSVENFACTNSSISGCTTFVSSIPSYSEIIKIYLDYYNSLAESSTCLYTSSYPSAISKAFEYVSEIYAITYNYDQSFTTSYNDKYPVNDSTVSLTISKVDNSSFSSDSCTFNDYPFVGLSITIQISESILYGFLSDVYGYKLYKIGTQNVDNPDDDLSDYVEQSTNSECFTNTINLTFTGTNSDKCLFDDSSINFQNTVYNVAADADTDIIIFDYTNFGLYGFIKCCDSGEGLNENLTCSACKSNCDCKCAGGCNSCTGAYYYDDANSNCLSCSTGCSTCLSSDNCTECESNYFLNDTECISCIHNCKNCSDNSTCEECDSGYVYNLNECVLNCSQPSCLACPNDSSLCSECDLEYYLNSSDSTCYQCEANCMNCSDSDTCIECNNGFELDDTNTCVRICNQTSCKVCANHSEECTECKPEYYLNSTDDQCYACEANCKNCSDSVMCNECNNGFDLDDTNTCVRICNQTSCKVCANHSEECTECNPEYYLKSTDDQCGACEAN